MVEKSFLLENLAFRHQLESVGEGTPDARVVIICNDSADAKDRLRNIIQFLRLDNYLLMPYRPNLVAEECIEIIKPVITVIADEKIGATFRGKLGKIVNTRFGKVLTTQCPTSATQKEERRKQWEVLTTFLLTIEP